MSFPGKMNIENYNTPDDAFAAASKLDTHGEWTAAIELYRQAAERWPEQAEYIQRCIKAITEKQSLQDGSCGPPGPGRLDRGTSCCCRSCILAILGLLAISVWGALPAFKAPQRAERAHQAIKPGASFEQVESLLTRPDSCFYEVKMNEEWKNIPRSKFIEVLETAPEDAPPAMRLQLHFFGIGTFRRALYVELDDAGNVTHTTEP